MLASTHFSKYFDDNRGFPDAIPHRIFSLFVNELAINAKAEESNFPESETTPPNPLNFCFIAFLSCCNKKEKIHYNKKLN